MSRIRALRCVIALIVTIAAAASAEAHSPYFTRTVTAVLPGGEKLELRLLHGDGIFVADPIWIVAVDENGKLRAHSFDSMQMHFFLDMSGNWNGYDFTRNVVLTLDPASMIDGGLFPKNRDELLNHNEPFWKENRGFVARPATAFETLNASVQYVFHYRTSAGFFFLYGVALGALFLWSRILSTRRPAVRVAAILINSVLVAVWSLPALYVVLAGDQPLAIAILVTAAGVLMIGALGTMAGRGRPTLA